MKSADFNKCSWMEENDVKMGKTWVEFTGKPNLFFSDIILTDGQCIGPVWPDRGSFVDLSSEEEDRIAFGQVVKIRYYIQNEDEDGEDGDEDFI